MAITDYFAPGILKGQTAFITGGGSGINLGIGEALAALGANVAICGRTQERLDAAREKLESKGARVFTAVADVRDYAAVEHALQGCRDALGPVNFLVCGAAGNFTAPAEALSSNGFRAVIEIDLLGAFHAARAAFAQLKETRGSILFVSAGQAYVPFAYQAHVGAAKAGIDNMMTNLALEWGRYGIRANSVVPGPIGETEGAKRLGADVGEEFWRAIVPLGRMGAVSDIGAMAAFLATPLAAYISGARIAVDGGQNLTGSYLFNQVMGDFLAKNKG